jgi:hypothetical protein
MHRTVIEPLDLQAFLAEDVSAEATSALIAQFAEDQLAEVQAVIAEALGHTPPVLQIVDGVKYAALDRVKPQGMIVFDFDLILDLFVWIYDLLEAVSPMLSGRYAASHEFYADGVLADPAEPPAAKVYQFMSAVPYAGEIEGEDGTPESKQAPNGVYQVVAVMAAARYPNAAVEFAFQNGKPTITIRAS